MPRGHRISAENKQLVINNFTELYEDTTEEFVNLIGGANSYGSVLSWVSLVRGFRPKQFQVDFYVNKLEVPNSLIQLFLDVSPAMVSIVGTSRDVYRETMRAVRYNPLGNNGGLNVAVAKNMAYVVARLGQISYRNNTVPNWRKPSDMSQGVWLFLKIQIELGVREGEEALNIEGSSSLADRLNANAPEVVEVVEDDAFIDADGQAQGVSEPIVLTDTFVDVSTGEEIQAPVDSDGGLVIEPRALADLEVKPNTGITPNWAYQNYNSLNFSWRNDSTLRPSEGELANTLRLALALQEGYYTKEAIIRILKFIKSRGFSISRSRSALEVFGRSTGRTQNTGSFLTIQIKADTRRATRFNRLTWNTFILNGFNNNSTRLRIREFLEVGEGEHLRTTRFSGRGANLSGVLAIPYNGNIPLRDSIPSFLEVEAIYNGLIVGEAGASVSTTDSEEGVSFSSSHSVEHFYFLGFSFAPSGNLYNSEVDLKRMVSIPNMGDSSSRREPVFVFWFGKITSGGGVAVYQLQWGSGEGIPSTGINDLQELNSYFKNNQNRLSQPHKLQLYRLTPESDSGLVNTLLDLNSASMVKPQYKMGGATSTFNLQTDNMFYRNQPFNVVAEASFNVVDSQGASILTKEQLIKSSKTPLDKLTFGWELEFYLKQGNSRNLVSELNSNNKAGALGFNAGMGEGMPVNGGKYGIVNDGSLSSPRGSTGLENREDENFLGYDEKELVSPVLLGEKGYGLVTKACESLMESSVRINASDGLHVHFDIYGRSPSKFKFKAWEIANVMINYTLLMPIIDKYQSVSRTRKMESGAMNSGGRWARAFSKDQITQLKEFSASKSNDYVKLYKEIYNGDSNVTVWKLNGSRNKYHQSRYRTINIHSAVTSIGTMEFRQGSPSTDPLYINNWIKFCYYLIMASKNGILEEPTEGSQNTKNMKLWSYCEWMLPDSVASYIANATYIIDGRSIEQSFTSDYPERERR